VPEPTATRSVGPGRFTDIRRFAELDSTNRWLLEQARTGAAEGLVAVADHQTAGRGRLGRAWVAPPKASLLVSVLLRPELAPARSHLLTIASGLAVADAVTEVAGFEPGLKWPNDLLAGGRKLAGMLAEAVVSHGQLDALVVGLGVNVNWAGFPPEIAETATACNLIAGRAVDVDALLFAWLDGLDGRCAALFDGDTDAAAGALVAEYRDRCVTVGQAVRVEMPNGVLVGIATGIDDTGRLVVDRDGEPTTVSVGDVVHVRPNG
jgi:BirA family biotin operon repressor/biotin-[acetyl-CoA-carboxylase] ligase